MEKRTFITLLVAGMFWTSSVYAVHPGSPTSQTPQEETAVVTQAVPVVSPWSGKVLIEMERSALKKPLDALSNQTTLQVGRKLGGIGLRLDSPVENTFVADTTKTGMDQYITLKDPSLVLSRSNLLEISGAKASGDLRATLPMTEVSRRNGNERNPHNGIYRYTVSLVKEMGRWSLSAVQVFKFYNYRGALNTKGKENLRFALVNELAVSYKLTDMFSVSSLVDFLNKEKRRTSTREGSLDWITSLDVEPLKNLSVSAGIKLTAPDQTIRNYFKNDQSKLENTAVGLTVSYKFI